MSDFKDMLAEDLDTFINEDEFADEHTVSDGDGTKTIKCVVQSPTAREQFTKTQMTYENLNGRTVVLHCRAEDFDEVPNAMNTLILDDVIFRISNVVNDLGILSITLAVDET